MSRAFALRFARPKKRQWKDVTVEDLDWAREYNMLASHSCATCQGSGLSLSRDTASLCACVCRRIFGAMIDRYQQYHAEANHTECSMPKAAQNSKYTSDGSRTWCRPREEYCADVWLLAKRILDAEHFKVFALHFIECREWRECSRRMHVDKGRFFHCVYRVMVQVGRAAVELRPYPLYPVDAYLGVRRAPFLPTK